MQQDNRGAHKCPAHGIPLMDDIEVVTDVDSEYVDSEYVDSECEFDSDDETGYLLDDENEEAENRYVNSFLLSGRLSPCRL